MANPDTWNNLEDNQHLAQFTGRQNELETFERELIDASSPHLIFYISGQGGVGKTELLHQFQRIALRNEYIVLESDEQQVDIPSTLAKFAKQLSNSGMPLKKFESQYKKYRQLRQEIETDEAAPKGWIELLGRLTARIGFAVAGEIPLARQAKDVVDPDLVEAQLSEWTRYLIQKLGNRHDEVALMSEPVSLLTGEFFSDLNRLAARERLLLCYDNYEFAESFLDPWFEALSSDHRYHPNVRFLVAGRTVPDLINAWAHRSPILRHFPLDVFNEVEAEDFLDGCEVTDPHIRTAILDESDRLPILMSLLASEATGTAVSTDHISSLVDRYLRWVPENEKREFALLAAIPRYFNMDILEAVTDKSAADLSNQFEWLCRRPFVQKREPGWRFHAVVRRQFALYVRARKEDAYRSFHSRLADYYEKRAETARKQHRFWRSAEWQRVIVEWIYHFLLAGPDANWQRLVAMLADDLEFLVDAGTLLYDFLQDPILEDELSDERLSDIRLLATHLQIAKSHSWGAALPLLDALIEWTIEYGEPANKIYLLRASTFWERGETVSAEADIEMLLEEEPENISALNLLAIVKGSSGDVQEALRIYDLALTLEQSTVILLNRGSLRMQIGNVQGALDDFNAAAAIDPRQPYVFHARAKAYMDLGRYKEAQKDIERCLRLGGQRDGVLITKAQILYELHSIGDALKILDKLIDDKGVQNAVLERARMYSSIHSYDSALQDYDRYLDEDPDALYAIIERGHLLDEMGNYGAAIAAFDRALDLAPDFERLHLYKAETHRRMGQSKQAIEDFDAYLVDHPGDRLALYFKGLLLRSQRQYDQAIDTFERILRNEPDSRSGLIESAITFAIQARYLEANERLGRVLAIDPDSTYALFSQVYVLGLQREYEAALKAGLSAVIIEIRRTTGISNLPFTANNVKPYVDVVIRAAKLFDVLVPSLSRGLHQPRAQSGIQDRVSPDAAQVVEIAGLRSGWDIALAAAALILVHIGHFATADDCYSRIRSEKARLFITYNRCVLYVRWKGIESENGRVMRLHDELIKRLTEDPNDVTCLYCMAGVAALHGDGESALAQLDTVLAQSPYFVEFAYHDLAWQPYEDDERFQRMVMSRFTADDPVSTDSTVKQ